MKSTQSRFRFIILLSDKQNTQGVSSAMRGHRASGTGNENLFEYSHSLYLLDTLIHNIVVTARVRYEYTVGINV